MSEFRISRLRFSWVGEWIDQTSYNKDQIVQYEGKAYVCLVPHTSNSFYLDLGAVTPKWDLMMTGQTWKGPWQQFTFYSLDNIAIFGGIVYKCNTQHTSGSVLDTDIVKWDVYAESKTWQSEWTTSTSYGIGDIAQYGGSSYECIVSHTSAATDTDGLEADYFGIDSTLVKWKLVKEGIQWRGLFDDRAVDSTEVRYKLNDIVKYGPSVYKCIEGHVPAAAYIDDSNLGVYTSSALAADATNGAVFDKSLTVNGLKIVVAAEQGAGLIPETFVNKVARMVQLFLDRDGAGIDDPAQENLIATLKGDVGTAHAGYPTAQRMGYGSGASYTPNWLEDAGIPSYSGYQTFLDSNAVNDMVWYLNSNSSRPGNGDDDAAEVIEHIFHTLHLFGVSGAKAGSAAALSYDPALDANWATSALYLAMEEAIAASVFDISGYGDGNLATAETYKVASKEYTYLLNFVMFEYSSLWDGSTLAPEWNDNSRTPAGVLANNPLGYALFNIYFSTVISKPSLATIRSIFQDNNAGASGYVPQIQNAPNVLEDTFTSSYWELWMPGLDFDSVWLADVIYQPGDVVLYGGYLYQSLTINNINQKPSFNTGAGEEWDIISKAYDVSGAWSSADEYLIGSVVTYGGDLYVALTDSTNQAPGSFTINAVYESTGSTGTTIKLDTLDSTDPRGITVGMTVIGEGFAYGQTVQSVSTDGDITTVVLTAPPSGTIPDSAVLTFAGANWSYWELMIPGFSWEGKWATGTLYNQDDILYYGNATYVCTREHTSALVNRPDNDLQNNYWTVYLQHDKTNALTQKGEIIIQSSGEKTPLQIGAQTNVLKVVGELPAWRETDFTPNVYYVATNGLDTLLNGTTADTAWKTIKYAAEQVAKGTGKANEKALLEANKTWAVEETYAWFLYQQNQDISPFDFSVDFLEESTKRDIRYTLDGVVTDLSRGQNARTVTNALSYFDLESTNRYTNQTVADQAIYYTAVIGQLFNFLELALTNTAPAQSFQVLEGYASPVQQYFNAALTIEADTITILNSLEGIIRIPLEAGSPASIPPANQGAYTTINLKSGTYEEALPIVLPPKTALNGDELRGAAIKPLNPINTLCTRTFGDINEFRVGSTVNMVNNTPVQFVSLNPVDEISTKIGGPNIVQGITYYVIGSSIRDDAFRVSATPDGEEVLLATNIGYMYVYGGNALNDMIRVQNGCGVRNLTMSGLLGTLTPQNEYSTRRPSGGSFVALDPGTGVNDTTAWITSKSPYIQNVTNFGIGCVGLKIDSTLHAGGNRSIVCNDFTQIISDGIGVWCTGGDSLVECVSVFSYYNYTGYFAEDGGRIRATNGNSSYGQFGAIAEGFDISETPAVGNVNNRSTQASASAVSALGTNAEILKIAFAHAGEEYYTTTTNVLTQSNNLINSDWLTDGNLNIVKAATTPFVNEDAWKIEGITNLTDSSYFYQDVAVSPQGRVYTGVSGTNEDGSGVDATFNVTVFSDGYQVSVNQGGSGYVVGNQIRLNGQLFGAQPTVNDIIVTVDTLSITAILTVSHDGTVPVGTSLPYTASIYAKKGTATYFDMYSIFSGYGTRTSAVRFNFTTGALVTVADPDTGQVPNTYTATILEDNWYRISYTFWDITAQNTSLRFKVYPRGVDGLSGSTNFYGAQLQTGELTFFLETDSTTPTSYANVNVSGAGRDAMIIADELRSGSVFQTRVLESSAFTSGGLGYKFQTNNAQSGDTEHLVLAGSEVATAPIYESMRLSISSGQGSGQYGIISQYNAGSKRADVLKESFDSLEITTTTASTDRFRLDNDADFHTVYTGQKIQFTPTFYDVDVDSTAQSSTQVLGCLGDLNNYMYVTSTAQLKVGQKINFTGTPFGGVAVGFEYFIINVIDDTSIQVSTSLGGGVWPLSNVNIEDPAGAPIVLTTEYAQFTLNFPSNTSYLYGTSTADMSVGLPVQFTGTSLGEVVLGQTYFIHDIYDANRFSISANRLTFDTTETISSTNSLTIADTSTLIPLNPITFRSGVIGGLAEKTQYWINTLLDGTTFTLSDTVITTAATASQAVTNLITVTSTAGFIPGTPIILTGTTFGSIENDKVYYIQVVNDATTFTISETAAGSAVPLLTAVGNIIVRTLANTVAVTDATGTMITQTPGAKATVSAGGGATMGASFYTETFGGIALGTTYYVLEKIETTPADVYTSSGNWTVDTTWVGNTLNIGLDTSPGAALLTALGTLGEDSTLAAFTMTDTTYGALTVTLTGGSQWSETPAGGVIIQASTVQTAPGGAGGATQITSMSLPTGAPVIKEMTIETTLASGTPVQLIQDVGSMQIGAVGWDHINPGTPLVGVFDSTTVYTISPRVKYSPPPFTQTVMTTLASSDLFKVIASNGFYPIAIPESGDQAYSTSDYLAWNVTITLPKIGDTVVQIDDPDNPGSLINNPTYNGGWVDLVYGNNTWVLISRTGNVLYSVSEGQTWLSAELPTLGTGEVYTSVAYTNGTFVAVGTSSKSAYSVNNGNTWTEVDQTIDNDEWVDLAAGAGTFVAIAGSSHAIKYSNNNGATWTEGTVDTSGDSTINNWRQIKFGNGRFVAVSSDLRSAVYSFDGVTWYNSNLAVQGEILEYGNGVFLLLNTLTGVCCQSNDGLDWKVVPGDISAYTGLGFSFDATTKRGWFLTLSTDGIAHKISTGAQAQSTASITATKLTGFNMLASGSGYTTLPTLLLKDPNNSKDAITEVRIGNGVLGAPTFTNYGSGYSTTSTSIAINGSGYADIFQTGLRIILKNLTRLPQPGDNIEFAGVNETYRVAKATVLRGTTIPNLEASVQISPTMSEVLSPAHNTTFSMRSRFSQVRLTNHDFLNIGFGNQLQSNYPGLPENTNLEPQDEIQETNNGRVFYSSTDQDGNFRVGDLFAVEQATGIVTLSADEFGLDGLTELSIGGVALGGSPVVVTQFSTDGTFVANSNTIVPTEKAIKTYLTGRLSQGGSDTFTGLLTAGTVKVGGPDEITSTVPEGAEGFQVKIGTKAMFDGPFGNSGWAGDGLAMSYFFRTLVDPTRSGQQ